MSSVNASNDFIWALTSKQSSFLVKRSNAILSRDPFNLSGKNTKTASGLANTKAFGISQENGSVVVRTKLAKNANKPAKNVSVVKFNPHKSSRKTALAVANLVKNYRSDLKPAAVRRVSQYTHSKKQKAVYAPTVRGQK